MFRTDLHSGSSARMRFLALLFLVGFASASYLEVLEDVSTDVVTDFMLGMERSPSLKDVMGPEFAEEADEIESDVKTELGKSLREALDHVMEKIRDAVDHGKTVSQELKEKAKEIAGKLKNLGLEAGGKAKSIVESIKNKAKGLLSDFLEKIGIGKRSLNDFIKNILDKLNIKELMKGLKEKIAAKLDIEKIKEYIKKVFGEKTLLARSLLETLRQRGVDALKRLVDRILPSDVQESAYSVKETWEKIKEFFQGIGAQLKERFGRFADWLKNTASAGFDKAKDKAGKLKEIARQVIDHSKDMSAEVAREALEFLRPYKDDLGSVWDELKESVRKAIGRGD